MTTLKERIAKFKSKSKISPDLAMQMVKAVVQPQVMAMLYEATKKWLLKKEGRSIHVSHLVNGEIDIRFQEADGSIVDPFPGDED